MKKILPIALSLLFALSLQNNFSQSFNISNYKTFLAENQNLTYSQLTDIYNAGLFEKSVTPFDYKQVLYMDSVEIKYNLTAYEKDLLSRHGFMVTERVSNNDFIYQFLEIYHKDLPVFISADAILNAFHKSYDLILKNVELSYLIPKLIEFLDLIHSQIPQLETKYSGNPGLLQMLYDVDLYLTVARYLLNNEASLYYQNNSDDLDRILTHIELLEVVNEPLFSEDYRLYDYSQFKVRGHYTDEYFPQLAKYFKAMIWLGRTELYLIPPNADNVDSAKIFRDTQRQIIDSYMISELCELAGVESMYNEFEKVISAFVGEQDNATLPQMNSVFQSVNVSSADQLLDSLLVETFQDSLSAKPFADQKILSQILMSNPFDTEKIKPASAFLIFGQRFVVDSYITGNVVYDKVNSLRMLPSTLDILFAFGNSAAAQLLNSEIEQYNYAPNLAALRYLIDSYNNDFWEFSIYNLWLNSIRTLNPPGNREQLPEFMQTAAWWQQKLNTQLSSWTELRHDNLLYAKQSYTGGVSCSYPYGYVEPIPEFFSAMKLLADEAKEKFSGLSINLDYEIYYFESFSNYMDTLKSISQKELSNVELSDEEKHFMKTVVYDVPVGCGINYDGWYLKLHYNYWETLFDNSNDQVVADYHTAPTDENGGMVGWVKHAGTGWRNLSVVIGEVANVGKVAFCGPVNSYYEFTSDNFFRINDEEWRSSYFLQSSRPDWVNLYLANSEGNLRGTGINLVTGVKDETINKEIPTNHIIVQNYPNPFNPETIISFTIPSALTNSFVELSIYNIQGELVKKLLKEQLPSGNYLTKWNGKNESNQPVSSGIYFYEVKAGSSHAVGKMNLLK
ncbi:MAG: DUF3160 domain-containing protein [Bacteroidota bacterium]